jgi:hypothetical protein
LLSPAARETEKTHERASNAPVNNTDKGWCADSLPLRWFGSWHCQNVMSGKTRI